MRINRAATEKMFLEVELDVGVVLDHFKDLGGFRNDLGYTDELPVSMVVILH